MRILPSAVPTAQKEKEFEYELRVGKLKKLKTNQQIDVCRCRGTGLQSRNNGASNQA